MIDYQAVAIIPAAGAGLRMNAGVNKIWLSLQGRSILEHVLRLFQELTLIDHIVLAVNPAETSEVKSFINQNKDLGAGKVSVVSGGNQRQNSVLNGLAFLSNWPGWHCERKIVLIHDAARVLVTEEIIGSAIESCLNYRAIGIAVPVKDTIKEVDEAGLVAATLERSKLWAVQTPQVFDFDLIKSCYEKVAKLERTFTDDCSVAEYCGHRVKLIMGSYENFKITTPEDLIVAEAILRRRTDADRARI